MATSSATRHSLARLAARLHFPLASLFPRSHSLLWPPSNVAVSLHPPWPVLSKFLNYATSLTLLYFLVSLASCVTAELERLSSCSTSLLSASQNKWASAGRLNTLLWSPSNVAVSLLPLDPPWPSSLRAFPVLSKFLSDVTLLTLFCSVLPRALYRRA